METENTNWKSPRAIEEELKAYRVARFERQMQLVDDGQLPRAIALTALQEEFESVADLGAAR